MEAIATNPRIKSAFIACLVCILLLPLFKPSVAQSLEYLGLPSPFSSVTYNVIILAISIAFAALYFRTVGLDFFGGAAFAFFAITALATVSNRGDLTFWAVESLPCLGAALGVGALWRRFARELLEGVILACALYLALNLFFLLFGADASSGSTNYLFYGYRNTTFRIAIPAFACSLLLDSVRGSRPSARTLIIFLIGLLEMVVAYSATSVCGFAAMAVAIALSYSCKIRRYLNGATVLGAYIVFFIGVIVLRVQEYLGFAIEGVLGRTTTLTGRTYIWNEVFHLLDGIHFIKGYGESYIWNSIAVDGTTYMHAHNELLHVLMLGGVFAAITFVIMIGATAFHMYRQRHDFGSSVLSAALLAYCIIGVAEVTFFSSTFLMLAIMYYYCRFPHFLHPNQSSCAVQHSN